MAIVHVNGNDFETQVLQSKEPVLVDFWAAWCGPCQMLAPVLEQVAAEDNIKVAKINVDENQELAISFGIVSIPTLLVFKAGKIVKKSVGLIDKAAVLKLME